MADEIELTELTDIVVMRQDGVRSPASGKPFLLMKSLAKDGYDGDKDAGCGCCDNCGMQAAAKAVNSVGGIDEKPDIAGAQHVLAELGKLVASEAAELAAGAYDEIWDIQTLTEAICLMQCFLRNEMYGDEDDGSMMKSADGLVFKAHRKFSSDERRSLASEGKALPDGSYPIPDEDALHRAAILARSGHGDVAAAKRLIAKRAKELGVANPLDHDTQKDTAEPEGSAPETTPADGQESGEVGKDADLDAKIEQAVAKAVEERTKALADELAVLKDTPIPGGPMLTSTAAQRDTRAKSDALAKAAYHKRLADATSGDLAKYHREEAAKAEAAAA